MRTLLSCYPIFCIQKDCSIGKSCRVKKIRPIHCVFTRRSLLVMRLCVLLCERVTSIFTRIYTVTCAKSATDSGHTTSRQDGNFSSVEILMAVVSGTSSDVSYTCQISHQGMRIHETTSATQFDCRDSSCGNSCRGGQCVAYVTCKCMRNGKHPPRTDCWRPGAKVRVRTNEACCLLCQRLLQPFAYTTMALYWLLLFAQPTASWLYCDMLSSSYKVENEDKMRKSLNHYNRLSYDIHFDSTLIAFYYTSIYVTPLPVFRHLSLYWRTLTLIRSIWQVKCGLHQRWLS